MMGADEGYRTVGDAARRLVVSAEALRLYEERGLVNPLRTAAGWRAYGPTEIAAARRVARLRALGLSLKQIERALAGDARGLAEALAARQARLMADAAAGRAAVVQIAALRRDLAARGAAALDGLLRLADTPDAPVVAFDLPWPWGGERFALGPLKPVTYLTGPLGSGKTRLAKRLAEELPGAVFLGPERLETTPAPIDDPAIGARVAAALAWLLEDGATPSPALDALLPAIEAEDAGALVVDMVEDGLDEATQLALAAWLRRRPATARALILMTRSSAILDLDAVGPDAAILLCPANHAPPPAGCAPPRLRRLRGAGDLPRPARGPGTGEGRGGRLVEARMTPPCALPHIASAFRPAWSSRRRGTRPMRGRRRRS